LGGRRQPGRDVRRASGGCEVQISPGHRYSATMLAQQVIALQTELHRPKPL
jgi:hypothetical protein